MRVVAEWGQTNQGSVEVAVAQAEATRNAGAWGAKWQLLRPDKLASSHAPAYWAHAQPGMLQRDVFQANGMIDDGAWAEVKAECDRLGVTFLATPFDLEAVAVLDQLDVAAIKIASGDITYQALLRAVGATERPVLLSTGASSPDEIHQALRWLWRASSVTLLACDLVYPCPFEAANLARIGWLGEEFDCPVGYSDHTTWVGTALPAAALGATVLEKHCTLDPSGPVPDDQMGLTPDALFQYVGLAKNGAKLRGSPHPHCSDAEMIAKAGARRSWHATRDLPAGHIIREGDVEALRPCPAGSFQASVDPVGFEVTAPWPEGEPILVAHVRARRS